MFYIGISFKRGVKKRNDLGELCGLCGARMAIGPSVAWPLRRWWPLCSPCVDNLRCTWAVLLDYVPGRLEAPGLTTSGIACSELSKAVLVLTVFAVFAKSGATNSFRSRSTGAATCNYSNFLDCIRGLLSCDCWLRLLRGEMEHAWRNSLIIEQKEGPREI